MAVAGVEGSGAPIDLAREPPFAIGDLSVSPATLQVSQGDQIQTLEPRIMQVLVALARRRGEVVSRDDLMASGWGGRIVGEDALYRCVIRVRKLGEETGAFTIENVRSVGYRLDETGAPPKLASKADAPKMRWPWVAGAAGVILAAGAGAWLLIGRTTPVRAAVLGFDSAEPGLQSLAKLVTDRTLSETAGQAPTLPRTTSGRGAMLSVSGLISRAGDHYNASIHINDVADGATLWSAEVSGTAESLPQQVAAAAAGKISCGLAAYRPGARLDQQSRSLWLEACDYLVADAARVEIQRAAVAKLVARAPDFADGLAMKSIIDARRSQGLPSPESEQLLAEARADAARAIKLNPDLGMAYVGQAVATPWAAWAQQEAGLRQGLARAPDDPFLHSRTALMLSNVGRMAEADQHAARSVQLAPYAVRLVNTRVSLARAVGDIPAAQEIEARTERQRPGSFYALSLQLDAALQDDPQLAVKLLAEPARHPPFRADGLAALQLYAQTLAAKSDPAPAVEALSKLLVGFEGNPEGANRTIAELLRLGAVDQAFEVLNRLAAGRQGVAPMVVFLPEAAALRRDPRFPAFAQRAGLIAYWRATKSKPDICTGPRPEPECKALLGRLTYLVKASGRSGRAWAAGTLAWMLDSLPGWPSGIRS